MNKSRKIIPRSGRDRREIADRRRIIDRRKNNNRALSSIGTIFNTEEACIYLGISRPTYLKYIAEGKIRARKIGRGWKVSKNELDRLLQGY